MVQDAGLSSQRPGFESRSEHFKNVLIYVFNMDYDFINYIDVIELERYLYMIYTNSSFDKLPTYFKYKFANIIIRNQNVIEMELKSKNVEKFINDMWVLKLFLGHKNFESLEEMYYKATDYFIVPKFYIFHETLSNPDVVIDLYGEEKGNEIIDSSADSFAVEIYHGDIEFNKFVETFGYLHSVPPKYARDIADMLLIYYDVGINLFPYDDDSPSEGWIESYINLMWHLKFLGGYIDKENLFKSDDDTTQIYAAYQILSNPDQLRKVFSKEDCEKLTKWAKRIIKNKLFIDHKDLLEIFGTRDLIRTDIFVKFSRLIREIDFTYKIEDVLKVLNLLYILQQK